MNKILILSVGLLAMAGCAKQYDYYTGNVRYYQDGPDCVYTIDETGERQTGDIRDLRVNKQIVYRQTMCHDLYTQDTADTDAARRTRRTVVPATTHTAPAPVAEPAPEPVAVIPARPMPQPTCAMARTRTQYILIPQNM
ncbi:hypothetical protein HDR63_00500 [bacterium]|nr:hypothetical protein [bacterium]